MCARYTLRVSAQSLGDLFQVDGVPELEPRYNIAPTQDVPVILENKEGLREFHMMRWGLVPMWAKDLSIGNKMLNAKSETVFEKPAFKGAAVKRRCLIPADGFYEWNDEPVHAASLFDDAPGPTAKTRKQPYHFTLADGRPFAFGGLYERWTSPEGATIETCTILTCAPNELVAQLHDRMPVIIPPGEYASWMSRELTQAPAIATLMATFPAEGMRMARANPKVGNPRNESADMLDPA